MRNNIELHSHLCNTDYSTRVQVLLHVPATSTTVVEDSGIQIHYILIVFSKPQFNVLASIDARVPVQVPGTVPIINVLFYLQYSTVTGSTKILSRYCQIRTKYLLFALLSANEKLWSCFILGFNPQRDYLTLQVRKELFVLKKH